MLRGSELTITKEMKPCFIVVLVGPFSPNVDLVASVDSNGWHWCAFSRLGIVNCLTIGLGRLLGSLRSRFSASDTVPITLNIVKTFPTGWKNLPQELVDEILTYLEDDSPSLISCSRSCKALFCSSRPLIHRTLCLSTGHQTDRDISSSSNRAQFDNLRLAERAQVLQYTTRLIIRLGDDFVPENLRPHLQYFRIIRGIISLEIYRLNTARFLPAFEECFGHIVPTLRSLILVGEESHVKGVYHFVPRFPLLRDLDLAPLSSISISPLPRILPEIVTPPSLNGTLRLTNIHLSIRLIQSLVKIPGGIHFRSIEIMDGAGTPLQAIIDACSSSVESITFRTILRERLRLCAVVCARTHLARK